MSEKKEKPKNIRELVNMMNKEFGFQAVKLATEIEGTYLVRRPCGIFSIDLATAGGLPAGTMNKIGGAEGLGKNYFADMYLAQCQRIYGDAARMFIVSSEYPYDKLRARDNGVRIALTRDEVEQLESSLDHELTKEEKTELTSQTGEIVMVQGLSMDKTLAAVLEFLESDFFHIGLVDSMDSLLPEEQEERLLGDPKVGSAAIVQTDFMKRFHRAIGRVRKTMLLTLGQARANIPRPGQRSWTANKVNDPYAVKHGLVGKIVLSSGGYIQPVPKGPRIGKVIRWTIEKGKAGFHDGVFGEVDYIYKDGVDKIKDFVEVAKKYVKRAGKYYELPTSDGGTTRVIGLEGFAEYARNNPDEVEYIKGQIYVDNEIAYSHHEVKKRTGRQGRKATSKKAGRKTN